MASVNTPVMPMPSGPLDLLRWISDSSRAGSVALSRAAAAVLEALVLTVDNTSLQWPRPGAASWEGISLSRLGERAHYSGRSVARALPELEQLGVVEVTPRDGRPHIFRLSVARIAALWGISSKGAPPVVRDEVTLVEPPLTRRRVVPSVAELVDALAQALVTHGLHARTERLLGFLRGGGARFDGIRRNVGGLTVEAVEAVRPEAAQRAADAPSFTLPTPRPSARPALDAHAEAVRRLVAARELVSVEIAQIDEAHPGFSPLPPAQWARFGPEVRQAYRAKAATHTRRLTLARWLESTEGLSAALVGAEALARIREALRAVDELKLSPAV